MAPGKKDPPDLPTSGSASTRFAMIVENIDGKAPPAKQPPAAKEPPAKEPPAFSVGHDDKIDGIYRPGDQRRDWSVEGRLELMEPARAPPAAPDIEVRPPTQRRFRLAVLQSLAALQSVAAWQSLVARRLPLAAFLTLVALLVAGAGFFLWGRLRRAPPPPVPVPAETLESRAPAPGSVHIDSEPSGAVVFIDGQEAGTTPLLVTNAIPAGKSVKVRVTLPGYRPWFGVLQGGGNAKLSAQLRRR
jgi:hypothetical protein